MLQRAASNAYSWWWASHIRTKQSKWLEQNLQDMEEKVAYTIQLIEEDGDSFAKRAEMYYKKRPEIIGFVEEAFRAYRALASRYDHLSTELQNATTTIAAVCPDQVHFAMDDDDEDATKRIQKKHSEHPTKNIPKVPNMPKKDLQGTFTSPTKKLQSSKSTKKPIISKIAKPKSGLSKPEGLKEIDKLQKQILVLQTEKEFVKGSYESWLAKYWEIEDQINEVQQKVCCLQDEFGEGMIIEDDDARNLMTATALKSCQQTLDRLQDKQEKSGEEEKVKTKRVGETREKFESVKSEANEKMTSAKDDSGKAIEEVEKSEQGAVSATQEREDLKSLREKIKEQFEDDSSGSPTMTEMAEKIDEVVDKVVNLEIAFSSQTSLVQRLRTEASELQEQIRTLEEDKAALINEKNDLSSKLMGTEEKLCRLQEVNQSIEDQNTSLQAHYTEANCNLDHLSDRAQRVKLTKDLEHSSQMKEKFSVHAKSRKEIEGQEAPLNPNDDLKEPQSVKLSDILEVRTPSETEKKCPSEVQFVEGIGGVEDGANFVNEKLPTEKPDDERKHSFLLQNEEKSMAKAMSAEEFKEQEEKQNRDDVPEKARDVQTEVLNDIKEAAVNQYQTSNYPSKLSEKSQDQMKDEEIDKQALLIEPDNLLNVKRKEQVAEEEKSQDQTSNEPGKLSEKSQDQMTEEEIDKRALSAEPASLLNVKKQEQVTEQEYEPDWKQMFLNGLENREKTLLAEYTTVLRNCKELKKKLNEADMKTGNCNNETTVELRELRSANTEKDEEIRSLRQKLRLLQAAFGNYNDLDDQYAEQKVTVTETPKTMPTDREVDIKVIREDHAESDPGIEEKFRMGIDELLEENLEFWLRFSTSFHQIQKFETEVKDLQAEASKLEEREKKQEGSSSMKYSLKSDGRPLYRHLAEIQTELAVWLEKSASLQEELKSRCSSLCDIQEEITEALKLSAEDDDFKFTSHQAAKFQGEILNMKQENNKVADELQAGLDHVTNLKLEVEKTLNLLGEKFGLSETKSDPNKLEHSDSRSKVPLRSFIFGVKPKKQRSSFFSNMHPALARKYNGFMSGASR